MSLEEAKSGIALGEIVRLLGAEQVCGRPELRITGLTELGMCAPDKMTFFTLAAYAGKLAQTDCAALLTADELLERTKQELPKSVAVLVCRKHSLADSVRLLFEMFAPAEHPLDGEKDLSAHAIIGEGTEYGEGTVIGRAVIGKNCSLGKNCRIASGVYIANDVVMGDDCVIWPNVTVYSRTRIGNRVAVHAGSVLGGDGFGYTDAAAGKERIKKPHLGRLVIEDDVEIGSNCCLDRALLSETRIGEKTKIDNLVHIAHNITIGKRVIICAQVGFGGSTHIGDDTMIAGHACFADHIRVGKRNLIYGASVVIGDTKDDEHLFGYPAQNKRKFLQEAAMMRRLPDFMRRLLRLESGNSKK